MKKRGMQLITVGSVGSITPKSRPAAFEVYQYLARHGVVREPAAEKKGRTIDGTRPRPRTRR